MPKQKEGGHKEKKLKIPREVEADRQQELAKQQEEETKKKLARDTEEGLQEEKESIEILQDPKLLDRIVDEIQDKKVVGERETIEAILIIVTCRKVKNLKPTSSNLLVNDESGLGKDHIVKAVLDFLPKEEVYHRTKITPELLAYWHNSKFEPDWTWEGKILYLEDASNNIINSGVFKVFSSGGSKATVLIKQTPVDIEVKGKPSMIVTSYEANPKHENLRRYPICFLDGSEDQTLNIMMRQSEEDELGITTKYDEKITEAIRKLGRVKVVIPFAKKLPYFFPRNYFMRTHFKRFLDYIKSSACLHQYQREKDDNGNVIAIGTDYEIARKVLLKTTSNPSMIPLTRALKNCLEFFEKHPNDWFAISDIETKFPVTDRTIQTWIKKLHKYNFLLVDTEKREGVKKPVSIYIYNNINKIELPNWISINSSNSFNSFNSFNSVNNSTGEQQIEDKTNKTKQTKRFLTKEKPLNEQINDLKLFCFKEKKAHRKIWYDSLKSCFSEIFISKCLKSGLLKKLPNEEYVFGG